MGISKKALLLDLYESFSMARNSSKTIVLVALTVCMSLAAAQSSQCNPNPCMVEGICLPIPADSFVCLCPEGFGGELCEIETAAPCTSNPCQNNGTCQDDGTSFNCSCADGFLGPTCEEKVDVCMPNPCEENGLCLPRNDDTDFFCLCPFGVIGKVCETEIDDCQPNPCMNGGTCEDERGDFTCNCPLGYTGKTCEDMVDSCSVNPCMANGSCFPRGTDFFCLCPIGFTGKTCEMAPTTVKPTDAETTQRQTTATAGGTSVTISGVPMRTNVTSTTADITAKLNATTTETDDATAIVTSTIVIVNGTTAVTSEELVMTGGDTRTTVGGTTPESDTTVMTNIVTTATGTSPIPNVTTSSSVTEQTSSPQGGLQCFQCNGVSQCTANNIPVRSCPQGQMCFSANITIGLDPATSLQVIRRGCENIATGQRGCVTSRDLLSMRPDFLPIQIPVDETSGRACLCASDNCNNNINQEDTDILVVQLDTTGLSDSIVLTWNVLGIGSNVDGFYVEVQVNFGNEWVTASHFLGTDERMFILSGLQGANVTAVRVVAVDQSKQEVSKSLPVSIRHVESGTKIKETNNRSRNIVVITSALASAIVLISAVAAVWLKKRNNQIVQEQGPIANGV